MQPSLFMQCVFEYIGTLVLILLGCGVVACVSLKKSKGEGAGWIVVTFAWGLAVTVGVWIAGPFTGAHLNPAVSVALAASGKFPWASVAPYVLSQILGALSGAALVYIFYKDHFDATDDKDAKLGVFATIPAIKNKWRNMVSELIGTFLLVLVILFLGDKNNSAEVGLGTIGAIPVGLLIVVIGMALGGTTGYAINPARDLGPRLAHSLLPIRGKGPSQWDYCWVPILGPVLGGLLAALVYWLIVRGLASCPSL